MVAEEAYYLLEVLPPIYFEGGFAVSGGGSQKVVDSTYRVEKCTHMVDTVSTCWPSTPRAPRRDQNERERERDLHEAPQR